MIEPTENNLNVNFERTSQREKLNRLKKSNNREIQSVKNQHENDVNVEKSIQTLKMKSEKDNFFQRYNDLKNNHKKILNRLSSRFAHDINNLKRDFLTTKNKISGLQKDAFYRQKKISTNVDDKGTYYEITVEIPRSEGKNLSLTTNTREIKLNFNRKFNNEYQDSDNSYNSSYIGESINKRLSLKDIVSEKEMEKTIYDNKTVFKLKKA